MLPKSVHALRSCDFNLAEVPAYPHADWSSYEGIIPANALCITVGRLSPGQAEYFVGDGVHRYADLDKFGAGSGFTMRGNYDAGAQYYAGNMVIYSDKLWTCIQRCTGQTPVADSIYWQELPITITGGSSNDGEPV